MHQTCGPDVTSDEIAWCSSALNFIAKLAGVPRTNSRRARSWLKVGTEITLTQAAAERTGFDVVVFKRGPDPQPGPEVEDAPGHVAPFEGLSMDGTRVFVTGANQRDAITQTWFKAADVLSVRRLG
jgi:hypothetical protein